MKIQYLLLVTFSMLLAFVASADESSSCQKIVLNRSQKSVYRHVLTGQEQSMRDLEPVFKRLLEGSVFELIVPKDTNLDFIPSDSPYSMEYSETDIDYYPYHLEDADTPSSRLTYKRLQAFRRSLEVLRRAQVGNKSLQELWKEHSAYFDFFFSVSPTSSESNFLFKRQNRLLKLVEAVKAQGPHTFFYKKENGDLIFTNKHFLVHLKEQGQTSLTLYRSHTSFDYFFYNLLLGKSDNSELRDQFAGWIESERYNITITRNLKKALLKNMVVKLRDKSKPIDFVLAEIAKEAMSSVLFTSLTTKWSSHWASGEREEYGELLELRLDLKKLPDWYLEQIFFGADMDVEVTFPYATPEQVEALKKSLSIVGSKWL